MRRLSMASILFALAATVASAASSPSDTVSAVLRENAAAFERGDYAAIEKLWAHGDDVSVFESGYANYGWADYRDHHLKPELKEMKNVRYRLDDIHSHVSGPIAWATFRYTISADYEGRKIDSAGLGTAALERDGDDWRIVHWHTSAPRKPPAPAPSN